MPPGRAEGEAIGRVNQEAKPRAARAKGMNGHGSAGFWTMDGPEDLRPHSKTCIRVEAGA